MLQPKNYYHSPIPQRLSTPEANSKTHDFFTSSFDTPVPPPKLSKSPPQSPGLPDVGPRTKSLTMDFFSIKHSNAHPPSPPSPPSPISRESSLGSPHSLSSSSDLPSPTETSPRSRRPSPRVFSSPLPPLSRFFPSRYTGIDESALGYPRRKFIDLESLTDDPFAHTNAAPNYETPRPSHVTPQGFAILADEPRHCPPSVDENTPTRDKSNGSLDMLPTPATSRAGSAYEPSPHPLLSDLDHPRREPHVESIATPLQSGSLVTAADECDHTSLLLERVLGQGSFSSVWLARDINGCLEKCVLTRRVSIKRQKSSGGGVVRRKSSKRQPPGMVGTKPWKIAGKSNEEKEDVLNREDEGDSEEGLAPSGGRLVALKLTERALYDVNDRTRVSFVREVEVLRHISHPSIVSFIHSFTTATHCCLILEHIGGIELFDLINSNEEYALMNERVLRRIWGELCRAVGWMHGVALVHRDIKLENILLTRHLRDQHLPGPLVKLTDFGLSRFVDPNDPLLTTRCGSESYAAPEIVIGRHYDGRETDAWACGVVLYALATRKLPFDYNPDLPKSRRGMLMRIAKAEYEWPRDSEVGVWRSDGLRRVVGRLLVRDPKKRSMMKELWDEEWMSGEGAPVPLPSPSYPPCEYHSVDSNTSEEDIADEDNLVEVFDLDGEEDGLIVDGDRIPSVASQEHS